CSDVLPRYAAVQQGASAHHQVEGIGIRGRLAAAALGLDKLHAEDTSKLKGDSVLQFEEFGDFPIEPVDPEMRTGLGIDKLGSDPIFIVGTATKAFPFSVSRFSRCRSVRMSVACW